jgi:hypothetical protein
VRLYEAEARYRSAGERFEADGGRLLPYRLEQMGYVDGGELRLRPLSTLQLGVAGGGGPDVRASDFGSHGWKVGGFVEASDVRRQGRSRWRALVGAARLEDPDVTRRQFVMQRADAAFGSRLRASEYLEVDVNPGWKRLRGEPHLDTTTFAVSAQVEVHRRVDLTAGFDVRHDPLVPEQRALATLPVRERMRGVQGAARVKLAKSAALRLGADFRLHPDGTQRSRSWDASLYASRLGTPKVSGALHVNVHDADFGGGTLVDGNLAWQPTRRLRLDAAAGTNEIRPEPRSGIDAPTTHSNWLRGGLDLQMFRGLWLEATGEWRGSTDGREVYLELGRQF